jgi:Na+/proline symporter/C4-dicarboxylate-specific signal transduction histidine kinase
MLSFNQLMLLLLIYMALLFAIAQWAQSSTNQAKKVRNSANTYALSLAVFCTSWTFFGNIALSSSQGIFPMAIHLGSTMTFIFMVPLLKKMVLLKNEFHSTSIADFISMRYHRSQTLAALISILCLVGIAPYLTIQLKSVITSFQVLVADGDTDNIILANFDILIVLMMAFFTIIFGVRHLDPTEKHPGMMVALAFDSLFKLLALVIAALWICYILNPGILSLFTLPESLELQQQIKPLEAQNWLSFILLGAIGIITLPRQFHVGIVECSNTRDIDKARWLFPLYLLIMNIFALPVALAGLLQSESLGSADLWLLTLPLADNQMLITTLVFLGGFAAATGMIMISAMTLSTMLTNHIMVPIILHTEKFQSLKRYILQIRWLMVFCVLFLSLFYYRAIGDSELIIKIGTISFIACAQFAPALIGGLIWRTGNLKGAIAGLVAGACLWFYSSLLPSVVRSGWLDWTILEQKSGFFYWFNPEHFFAIEQASPLTNSLVWSLLVNTLLYVGVSLVTKMSDEERKVAHQFVNTQNILYSNPLDKTEPDTIDIKNKLQLINKLFQQYMPKQLAEQKLAQCVAKTEIGNKDKINIAELSILKNAALNALAGVIGMASAYQAFNRINVITNEEQAQLASYFSRFLAQLQLSPKELFEQVNFHLQKRELLENHTKEQLKIINQLENEVEQRLKAEQEIRLFNEGLEQRVQQRTQQLSQSNDELNQTLIELKQTQSQLLENEKMASLGSLVAGVAHEVNTPIGIVLTSISFMKGRCEDILTALTQQSLTSKQLTLFTQELDQGFTLSLNNIKRAVKLIESFKLVAVDSIVDDARTINLHNYLQDVLRSLQPKVKQSNIKVELNCPQDIVIFSYPGAIAQITNNLVINSLLHAFEPKQAGKITISAQQQKNTIMLLYSDDGCSLDKESKAHLFDPFYTTRRDKGGTGLGAHIVYNLVTQRLKGSIELITKQKNGKSFKIIIPNDSRHVDDSTNTGTPLLYTI